MKIFLDTSSLFKLYHREADSSVISHIFTSGKVSGIFLSELAKIEFESTVWKKVRTKEISELDAKTILQHFDHDSSKYSFVPVDSLIIRQSRSLIAKYGVDGLRTLDSIQLATSIILKDKSSFFITTDKLLDSFFKRESLPTYIGST